MIRIIDLPPDLDGFVEGMIANGRYGSAGALVGDALRLLKEQAEDMAAEEAILLDRIEAQRQDDVPAEEVFAELRAKVRAAERRQAAE